MSDDLFVSLAELRVLVDDLKADFQRKANQAIEKDDLKQGWGALASMDACDKFLYRCQLRAGAFAPDTADARKEKRNAKPRVPSRIAEMRKRGA